MNNGKLLVGVVGSGAIAQKRHICELAENPFVDGIVLSAIDEIRAKELAGKYPIKKIYIGEHSYKDLAANKEVDAVIICTPHVLHAEQSIFSLTHGKHVLVEKPMATKLEDGQQMMDDAANNQVILMVGHHRRFQNCYRLGKEILNSGLLGNPRTVRALLKQPGPIEWSPGSTWFFNEPDKGGGVLLDLGIHMADIVFWLLDNEPVRCYSTVNDVATFYESAFSEITLKSGVNVVLDVSWGTFHAEKGVSIYCEKGVLYIDEYAKSPVSIVYWSPLKAEAAFTVQPHRMNSEQEPNFGVVDYFIDSILKNRDMKISTRYSFDALQVVLASWQSHVTKKAIEL
jgi:UDP-N-acetylglucosamine 3-dehydrogenase